MSFAEIKKSINSNLDVPLDKYWNRGVLKTDTSTICVNSIQADKLIDAIEITSNNGGFFHGVNWNFGFIGSQIADFMLTAYLYIDGKKVFTYEQIIKNDGKYDIYGPKFFLLPQETIQFSYKGTNESYKDIAIDTTSNFTSMTPLSSTILRLEPFSTGSNYVRTFAKEVPFKKSIKLQLYCNDGNYYDCNFDTQHTLFYYLND